MADVPVPVHTIRCGPIGQDGPSRDAGPIAKKPPAFPDATTHGRPQRRWHPVQLAPRLVRPWHTPETRERLQTDEDVEAPHASTIVDLVWQGNEGAGLERKGGLT